MATAPQSTKSTRVIYWIFTTIFVLLDSVIPALTFNSPLAKAGIAHLGYPDYFRIELSIGKIIGGILLILPMIPPRYKEWGYVGFGISLISALVGDVVMDGPKGAILPIVGMVILLVSYITYHKIYAPFKSNV
ncbi:DoxX family protein [Mucilaginibacter jinjuensis]|uniref:DoxX family protein n=1 Tax=Mucilaginibacter jinjuensis TaxID=1176721 RepID=A0ABY7T8Q7_9SPHI|nr:DoxX family protein [Mucilaginibacter jinjuensis]WCT12678.1 DoxX family protein [Mucilaginibacter jinjuensis]